MAKNQPQEQPCKAILTIDGSGAGQAPFGEKTQKGEKGKKKQNLAAKNALEQGSSAMADASAMEKQPVVSGGGTGKITEITVQYNPSSIKYRASVSENSSIKYEDQGNTHYQITTVTGENSVDMSFSLVFHSRYPGDPSVRQQMEQILDMIRRSPTKQVGFRWSKIQMEGRLVSFSGEYDMFDASGLPVSGHMDMTIETTAKQEKTSKTIAELEKAESRNA